MSHLVTCPVIQHEFWEPLLKLMDEMGFPTPDPSEVHAFLVLGVYTADGENRVVKPEHSGMLFIAWRCLYAAVVGSRVDDKPLDLEYAYYRTLQMTITRVTAYVSGTVAPGTPPLGAHRGLTVRSPGWGREICNQIT